MSERGSFVTGNLYYCNKCFDGLQKILAVDQDKYLCGRTIQSHRPDEMLSIIAGKVGGLGPEDELMFFNYKIRKQIEKAICHHVRIAVLADSGTSEVFTYSPSGEDVS